MGSHKRLESNSTAGDFQYAKCPLCDSIQSRQVLLCKDYNYGLPGLFKYVRCKICGFVYENPRPTSNRIMDLYPNSYGRFLPDSIEKIEKEINAAVHVRRFRIVQLFAPKGSRSIFDIGCGSGSFLEHMRRRGWSVSGLEPSAEHVRFAKTHLGLHNIYKGVWPFINELNIQVNVVSLFHVLEHLLFPIEALSASRSILTPGGIVVLETPNVQSWPARLFGPRWVTLDAPRHVNLFSKSTLRRCLERAGFEVLMLKTVSPSTMEYTESIRYILKDLGLRQYKMASHEPAEELENERHTGRQPGNLQHPSIKGVLHKTEMAFFRTINALASLSDNGCNLLLVGRTY
jgi:2-polyprenyl-3-methyl-5-hydroxy-6-metoxy-1,4-benzoquinol methylase